MPWTTTFRKETVLLVKSAQGLSNRALQVQQSFLQDGVCNTITLGLYIAAKLRGVARGANVQNAPRLKSQPGTIGLIDGFQNTQLFRQDRRVALKNSVDDG